MPPRWSAVLRTADDAGLVLADLGSRFASASFSTSLGAGFDTMTTRLRQPFGDLQNPRVPVDLAGEIFRTWRGFIVRVFVLDSLAWAGRLTSVSIHDVRQDGTCGVDLGWLGFVHDLEREQPELDASYADEFATVSASQLVRAVVDQSPSPIAHSYDNVQETAVNIGAIGTSTQDTSLSLILNQLKGASSDGVEYAFLIWNPADGPYLQPIGVGPTRYRLSLADAPGTGVQWSLNEYVSDVQAIFTNGDGNSDATETKASTDGPALHNGLRSNRVITVDAVNADGAGAARDAFLALHEDPVGITGAFTVQDTITTDEGGQEPAGLVKAGEIAIVPDALPFDPRLGRDGRTKAIASTSYDLFSGQLSVQLDTRAIRSRENERQTDLRYQARMIEPGLAHNILEDGYVIPETAVLMPNNTDVQISSDPIAFGCARTMKVHVRVELEITDQGSSVNDTRWNIGGTWDGEDWDHTDRQQMSVDYIRQGINGGTARLTGSPKAMRLKNGQHTFQVWARNDVGSYAVTAYKVYINS